MKEREQLILQKIQTYATQSIRFIQNMDFTEFSDDMKTVCASVFSLSQIGELVSKMDTAFIEKNNHIPWYKIRGLRNRIVHDYEGIRLPDVWNVLTEYLPKLINDIDALLE
jgi:uncharacterized protein with HEPN domain